MYNKSRKIKVLSCSGAILVRVCSVLLFAANSWAATTGTIQTTEVNGVKVDYYLPAALTPKLSADGKTLYDAVAPVIYIADPVEPAEPLRVASPVAIQSYGVISSNVIQAVSTIKITYIPAGGTDKFGELCYEFPADAKVAFEAAVAIWENTIKSSVPITIRAGWADLGTSTLGYSGGGTMHSNFSGAPLANTWYSASLANSFAGTDLDSSNDDMHITYNKNFTWYFGTDGNTPSTQSDFMSVVLHEITHGLNFSGTLDYSGGTGSWGNYPNIYDTFMEDGSGVSLLNTAVYPNPSTTLGSALTSGSIWFNGTAANDANGGARVKIYAPSTWSAGSSYSHLDYDTFAGTANRLMVYAISSGSSIHDPGPVTEGILEDLGWVVSTSTNIIYGLSEDFENSGYSPVGWSQEYIVGTTNWIYLNGGVSGGYPTAAHSGSYNAFLFADDKADHQTKLITPELKFNATVQNTTLTFWHYMENWYGDQDELRVYYKTSASGEWILLAKYLDDVATWTERTIVLPDINSTYYVAFEGNAKWGYGVCIDDVTIPNSDIVDPVLTSVNSSTPDGAYEIGDVINITINFSEPVTLAGGKLIVTLETGYIDQDVVISVIDGASVASGFYVVQGADLSSDLSVNNIALSGGTLQDAAGNDVELFIPIGQNLNDNRDIIIETSYTVTASVIGVGTISPQGNLSVAYGDNVSFIITADARRHITGIKTNGLDIAGSPYPDESVVSMNYTWNNITADSDIVANIETDYINVQITGIRQSGSNMVIEWGSSNGWQYICESADGFPLVWNNVSTGWVLSAGSLMSETDTNAWTHPQRMYRVNVRP